MDLRERLARMIAPPGVLPAVPVKQADMVHGSAPMWSWLLPGTSFDYDAQVKDMLKSSVVVAILCWLMRSFPEARPVVDLRAEASEGGQWQEDPDHRLVRLLETPNPFYDGNALWMATVMELSFGEAFWLKIRNVMGRVIQLWWVPRALMKPEWPNDGKTYISRYIYSPAGASIPVSPADVVHFRFGLDPANHRRGFSPLGALAREVYTDEQASNFTASVLRNLGVIGVCISPKEGVVGSTDAAALKKYVDENFAQDDRARAMAFTRPTDMTVCQYNLQGFDMGPIRDIAEERASAATGVPAAVVGFGTGLQQTKVGATMKELCKLAWTNGVIPLQRLVCGELTRSLLPEFGGGTRARVRFDRTDVAALQEEASERDKRILDQLDRGAIELAEARRALGWPVTADHKDIWFRKAGVIVLKKPGDQPPAPVAPPAPAGGNGNGNGNGDGGNGGEPEGGAKSRLLAAIKDDTGGAGDVHVHLTPQITVQPSPAPNVTVPITVEAPPAVEEVNITRDAKGNATKVRTVRK